MVQTVSIVTSFLPFQPSPNNERQTHRSDDYTATEEDSSPHETPASAIGDRRNIHISVQARAALDANKFAARRNVSKLLSAYR